MRLISTELDGLYIIEPKVFGDSRGFFMESYSQRVFAAHGIREAFVQDNISRSRRGTLRGLHYQLDPYAQGKLVRVTLGAVFDVAVDIRKGSPTFGRWFGHTLSEENKYSLYVPPGFAHGFLVLSDMAEFTYKCTSHYEKSAEAGIVWNDPAVGIRWPAQPDLELISPKDNELPTLERAQINFVYKNPSPSPL